jgi:isocitrate dehydrogenase (NAD+)
MFEAVHGSAPDIAGQGIANPTSLLLSACMLLDHVDRPETADRIRAAVNRVVQSGEVRTVDMGGGATTREYTDALLRALA